MRLQRVGRISRVRNRVNRRAGGAVIYTPAANVAAAIMAASPAAYWKLDEAADFCQDSSGNARHVDVTTGVTYRGQSAPDGRSYSVMGGSTSRISSSDLAVWTPGASGMSLMIFVRPTQLLDSRCFMSRLEGNFEWTWEQRSNGQIYGAIVDSGANAIREVATAAGVLVLNQWHCLVMTCDGNTNAANINHYLNSASPLSKSLNNSIVAGPVVNGNSAMNIACRPANWASVGAHAHAAFFTRVLTTAEIGTIMATAHAEGWF